MLVNRVADFFLLISFYNIYETFETFDFSIIFFKIQAEESLKIGLIQVGAFSFSSIDFTCLCLLLGAMGKSAQILLHTWLPDAMEGPTPVSALIHAATMVTAGVFLIARCSFLFEYSELSLNTMIIVGSITAIFGATTGIFQNDIKKIIAYSTCSQLGYMFLACGVSSYDIAIFHLTTHAIFKALLFLGAGAVIHSMGDEQDI